MNPLKKKNVPWWIWLTVTGAIVLVILPFVQSEEKAVHVVGAGVIDLLQGEDAPEGILYRLRTEPSEGLADTTKRFERVLELRPSAVLLAFDADQLTTSDMTIPTAKTIVQATVVKAEQNPSAVYMLGFVASPDADAAAVDAADEMNTWWTEQICIRKKIRCVDLPPRSKSPDTMRNELRRVTRRAVATLPTT